MWVGIPTSICMLVVFWLSLTLFCRYIQCCTSVIAFLCQDNGRKVFCVRTAIFCWLNNLSIKIVQCCALANN